MAHEGAHLLATLLETTEQSEPEEAPSSQNPGFDIDTTLQSLKGEKPCAWSTSCAVAVIARPFKEKLKI